LQLALLLFWIGAMWMRDTLIASHFAQFISFCYFTVESEIGAQLTCFI
jgi:hypothetical protein